MCLKFVVVLVLVCLWVERLHVFRWGFQMEGLWCMVANNYFKGKFRLLLLSWERLKMLMGKWLSSPFTFSAHFTCFLSSSFFPHLYLIELSFLIFLKFFPSLQYSFSLIYTNTKSSWHFLFSNFSQPSFSFLYLPIHLFLLFLFLNCLEVGFLKFKLILSLP